MKGIKITLLFLVCQMRLNSAIGQDIQACPPLPESCAKPAVTNLGIIYKCVGDPYTFTPSVSIPPGFEVLGYTWYPSGDFSPATVVGPSLPGSATVTTSSVCKTYSLAVNTLGPNMIRNGGFQEEYDTWTHTCMNTFYGNGSGTTGISPGHIKVGAFSGMAATCANPPYADVISHTGDYWGSGSVSLCVNAMNVSDHQVPYFWGQTVNLCLGQRYKFSYFVRTMEIYANVGDLPIIKVYGASGSAATSLQSGICSGCFGLDVSPSGFFGGAYLGMCQPNWTERSFEFTATTSGPTYICMAVENRRGKFGLDDISLKRIADDAYDVVTLCPVPDPVPTIIDPSPCVGVVSQFTIMGGPGQTVNYNITGPISGSPVSGSGSIGGSGLLTTPVTPTGPGTLCLNITGITAPGTAPTTCYFPKAIKKCVPVGLNPGPLSITVPLTKCQLDANFTITGGSANATTYTWTCTGPATIDPLGASPTVYLTGGTGVITISGTATNACGPAVSATAVITVNPNPSAAPNYSPACLSSGDPFTLHANTFPASGGPFTYSWTGGPIPYTSALSDPSRPGIVTPLTGPAYIYPNHLVITNTFGCTREYDVPVTVHPLPIAGTITGEAHPCAGDKVTMTISGNNYAGTWSMSGSAGSTTIDASTGVLTTDATITSISMIVITYTVKNPCYPTTPAATTNFTVTIKPLPDAEFTLLNTCTPFARGRI